MILRPIEPRIEGRSAIGQIVRYRTGWQDRVKKNRHGHLEPRAGARCQSRALPPNPILQTALGRSQFPESPPARPAHAGYRCLEDHDQAVVCQERPDRDRLSVRRGDRQEPRRLVQPQSHTFECPPVRFEGSELPFLAVAAPGGRAPTPRTPMILRCRLATPTRH